MEQPPLFSIPNCRKIIQPYIKILRKKDVLQQRILEKMKENEVISEEVPEDMYNYLRTFATDSANIPFVLRKTADILKVTTMSEEINIWMVEGRYVSLLKEEECPKTKFKIRTGHVIAAHVAFQKTHMLVDNCQDERFTLLFGYRTNDPKSLICVPVITPEEQCVAIIEMYRTSDQPIYGNRDLKITLVLAGWIGAAIQQNRDRIILQEQQKINHLVLDIVKKFYTGDVSVDEVISSFMQTTKRVIQAEKGMFFLIDPDSSDLKATVLEQGLSDDNLYRKSMKVSLLEAKTVAGSVARNRKSVLLKNLIRDKRFNRRYERTTGNYRKCILATPIKGGKTVYGVLELENKNDKDYNFSQADESFVRNIWRYCSLVLSFEHVRGKFPQTLYNLQVNKQCLWRQVKPCPQDEVSFEDDYTELPPGFHMFLWYIPTHLKSFMPLYTFSMLEEVIGKADIKSKLMKEFVLTVQKLYRNNPYHNFEHAFNVAHCIYCIIRRNVNVFNIIEMYAIIVAALCHDLDHLGVTNSFLVLSDHYISLLYAESCMENYHVLVASMVLENCNFITCFTDEDYKIFMREIKYNILATDIANHFKLRYKVNSLLGPDGSLDFKNNEHRNFAKSMMMTCADLSGCCKPFSTVMANVSNLYKEFYNQGDVEREIGYSPLPIMDRNKIQSVPMEQIQFMNVLVLPCTNIIRFMFPNCAEIHDLATKVRDTWQHCVDTIGTHDDWQNYVPPKPRKSTYRSIQINAHRM